MKHLLLTLTILTLASCDRNPRNSEMYCGYWVESIPMQYGVQSSFIQCDSVKVVARDHVIGYIGGQPTDVYGMEVLIHYKKCK